MSGENEGATEREGAVGERESLYCKFDFFVNFDLNPGIYSSVELNAFCAFV